MQSKVEVPHRKDCSAMRHVREGTWTNPWGVPGRFAGGRDSVFAYRDKAGGRRGSGTTVFLQVGCNDTRCPARLLLHWNRVLADVVHE
jgi:hypothetical protein